MRLILIPALVALCACASVVERGADTALLPIDSLLAQAEGASADPGPALAARAAALQARAASLAP